MAQAASIRLYRGLIAVLLPLWGMVGCSGSRKEPPLPDDDTLLRIEFRMSDTEWQRHHQDRSCKSRPETVIRTGRGDTLYAGKALQLKGRGNSTWQERKKPYSLRLREDITLPGMRPSSRYILLANAFDESFIRNAAGLQLSQRCGLGGADYNYALLYVNNSCKGLYLLTTRPTEPRPEKEAVLYISGYEDDATFISRQGTAVSLKEGKRYGSEERKKIERLYNLFESAVMQPDGIDPETGTYYADIADIGQLAVQYAAQEVIGNQDAGMGSVYLTCCTEPGRERISAGPLWDTDLSLNNPRSPAACKAAEVLWAASPRRTGDGTFKGLYYYLWQHEDFRICARKAYCNCVRQAMRQTLDSCLQEAERITNAAERDRRLYPENVRSRRYSEATARLKDYAERRMAYFDRLVEETGPMVCIYLCFDRKDTVHPDNKEVMLWVPAGEETTLPIAQDYRHIGDYWVLEATGERLPEKVCFTQTERAGLHISPLTRAGRWLDRKRRALRAL